MPGTRDRTRYDTQARDVTELEQHRPELLPWLRPLRLVLDAAAAQPWRGVTPMLASTRDERAPALHDAVVPVDAGAVRGLVHAVLSEALGATQRDRWRGIDEAELLETAVAHDDAGIARIAASASVDAGRLGAAAQLAALPLLLACARALAPGMHAAWTNPYCHVCGALPLLVEVLGLERARQLRCGRCGASWQTHVLRCPFCGERDHARLGSLVPDGPPGQVCWVETCGTCRGYWKTRAVLRAAAPEALLLDDARSLELDLAAGERGFARPHDGAFTVRLRLAPASVIVS